MKPLFNKTGEVVPIYQSKMTYSEWEFWRFYSDLGSGLMQILYIVYKVTFDFDNSETLFLMCFVELEIYLAITFKNFYKYPRPFWVFSAITPGECSSSFGDPSGHSFCAGFIITYVYFTWIFPKYYKKGETQRIDWIILTVSFIVLISSQVLMTMSRVVQGMHSIDQTMQGSLLGIWTGFMAINLLKPIFTWYLTKLMEKPA